MDNTDVVALPKAHGHSLTYSNENKNFELLKRHALDE